MAWSDELGAGRVHPELGAMRSAVSVGDTLVLGGVQRGGYGIADNPQAFLMNDGSGWRDVLDPAGVTGIQFMGQVNALEVVGDSLIVGGRFLSAGGQPMRSVASVGTAGWSSMGQGLMSSAPCPTWGSVVDLLRVGGVQYAAGSFLARDPQTDDDVMTPVARLQGSTWEAVTAGLAPPDSMGRPAVRRLLTWRNRLTAVGEVRTLVNSSEFGIAVLVNDTWQPMIPALASAQLDSGKSISDAVVLGEDLIIGGNFDSVAGSNTGGLARFDGVTWSSVLTQPEAFGRIDLQAYEGVLYVAGRRSADPTGPTLFRVVHGALEPLGAGSVIPYSVLVSTPHGLFAMGEGLVRIVGSTVVPQQISSWPNQYELSTGWYALTSAVYRPAADEIVIGGTFSANPPLWSNGLGALRFDGSVAALEIPRLHSSLLGSGVELSWQWPLPWAQFSSLQHARLEQRTRDRLWQTRMRYEPADFDTDTETWLVPGELLMESSEFRLVAETDMGDLVGESLYLRSPQMIGRSQWLGSRPNPFNPSTVLEFTMSTAGMSQIRVYSLDGRLVRELENGWHEPGIHETRWDGRDDQGQAVSSGSYVVVLDTPDARDRMKVLLAK